MKKMYWHVDWKRHACPCKALDVHIHSVVESWWWSLDTLDLLCWRQEHMIVKGGGSLEEENVNGEHWVGFLWPCEEWLAGMSCKTRWVWFFFTWPGFSESIVTLSSSLAPQIQNYANGVLPPEFWGLTLHICIIYLVFYNISLLAITFI